MPIDDWTRVPAGIFHAFHHGWIAHLSDFLNDGLLPPTYYALPEQVAGAFGPDVLTLKGPDPANGSAHTSADAGGVATMAPPRATLRGSFEALRAVHTKKHVAVRHVTGDRVVAIIEVVSPGNKGAEAEMAAFCDKVLAALKEGIHVAVLDLFPPGPRDPNGIHGVLIEVCGEEPFLLPPGRDRLMASYRAGHPTEAFLEPAAVGEALTDLPLFLSGGLHVTIPLEQTYQRAYRGVPARIRAMLEPPPG